MPNHHIEQQILKDLAYLGQASFGRLKPDTLMNNAFDYHLKALIRDKLIVKNDGKYKLSPEGLSYVDKLSFKTNQPRVQPKTIALFLLKNKQGQYLLAKRKTEPFIGKLEFISGKRHFGEPPEVHVGRELAEQLGAGLDVQYLGLADVRSSLDGQIVSHVTAFVYGGEYDGPAPMSNRKFTYQWAEPNEFQLGPAEQAVYQAAHEAKPFFLSLDAAM